MMARLLVMIAASARLPYFSDSQAHSIVKSVASA